MKNMKNIFKYLSIFAIAGTIGLQSASAVQVEQCKEGEEVHTNYYMFLEEDTVDGLTDFVKEASVQFPASMYTGADKFNNIQLANYLNEGTVNIVANGQSVDGDTEKTWTLADYWRKYYTGDVDGAKDANGMYTNGNNHYFFHKAWYVYEDANFTGGVEKNYADDNALLKAYISTNFSTLEDTELVKTGSMLPKTIIGRPETVFSSTNKTNTWHIERHYNSTSVPNGVPLGGKRYVFAPAAYFIRWCGPKSGTTPSTKKTVTYDANTTDTVAGMPANQEFSDECVNLRSERPTRTGYTFIGWAKTATATKADYTPGAEYCGDSVTLHAIWVKNQTGPFKIIYDANGGKDAPATQDGQAGSCLTISTQKPTLSGNTFLGWSTDKNARVPEDIYAGGKQYCGERGDLPLYAVWRPDTGVSAHLIAFSAVALGAVVALVIATKKNLFKQI